MTWLLNPYIYGGWKAVSRIAFPATTYNNVQVRLVLTTSNFDYSKVNSDGSDIRFTTSNVNPANTTPIDYWIESWNYNGTSIVWFKVPTAETTQVFMWYNNASAMSDQKSIINFMDRGLRWISYGDMTLNKAQYGGNDLNPNSGSVATMTVSGQTIGTTSISGRWEGWILPERLGEYTIGYYDDDGGRAWLNGTQQYNGWADGDNQTTYLTTLGSSPTSIKYEWYNNAGNGRYQLGVGTRTGRRTNLVFNPSFENGLFGWTVGTAGMTSTTITTDAAAGTSCLQMTRDSATGDLLMWTTEDYLATVAPTTNVVASAFIKQPSGTATTAYVQLNWFDANKTYITTSTPTASTLTTAWQRLSVSAAAPSNARYVGMVFRAFSLPVGTPILVDGCQMEITSTLGTYFDGTWIGGGWNGDAHASTSYLDASVRVNGATNPAFADQTIITSTTPYILGWDGTATGQRFDVMTSGGYMGAGYLKCTRIDTTGRCGIITSNASNGNPEYRIPASAGEVWTMSAYVKSPSYVGNVQARIRFESSNRTILQNTATNLVCSSSWQRVSHTAAAAPAETAYVRVTIQSNTTNDMTAGQELHISGALAERAGSAGVYFDGSIPPASWVGSANQSGSILYTTDRANLAINASFTSGITSWEPLDVGTSNYTLSSISSGGVDGGPYMRITRNVDGTIVPQGVVSKQTSSALALSPCVVGATYYASGYMRSNTTRGGYLRLSFYDSSFTDISSTLSAATTLSTSWQRGSVSAVAPAGAVYVGIRTSSGTAFTTGEYIEWDQLLLEQSTTVNTFFDGATSGSSWTGTANASPSFRATGSTTPTYPFPLNWMWGPKFDPAFRGSVDSQSAVIGTTPVNLDAALPQDIALWLDMSDASIFTKDGSNNVSAVADKSGLSRNFTTSGTGVTYVASGQNSKSVLRMGGSGYIGNTTHAAAIMQPVMTIMVAAKSSDAVDKDFVFYAKNGVAGPEAGTVYNGGGATTAAATEIDLSFDATDNPSFSYGDATTVVVTQFASRANTANPKVFGVRYKPASIPQIILNAATNPTAGTYGANPAVPSLAPTFVSIGSHGSTNDTLARWINGDIYEVLVWTRYLTDAEITTVTNYLYSKWAVSA